MPEKQKPKVETKPSPSLLRKLLGGPLPEYVYEQYPELAKAWSNRELAMPRETTMTNKVTPMNAIQRFLYGDAYAAMSPLTNTIGINMPLVAQDKINLEDILTHELTHVGQKPGLLNAFKRFYTNWDTRPEEQAAVTAELNRSRQIGQDIELPVNTGPSKRRK